MDAMSPAMLMQAYTYIHTYVHNDFQKKQEKSSAAKKEMISDHRSRVGARDYCYNFSQRMSGFIIYLHTNIYALFELAHFYVCTYIEQIVAQFLSLIMIDNSLLYGENSILTFRVYTCPLEHFENSQHCISNFYVHQVLALKAETYL